MMNMAYLIGDKIYISNKKVVLFINVLLPRIKKKIILRDLKIDNSINLYFQQ